MSRTIEPLHDVEAAPSLPDRSDLEKVYSEPLSQDKLDAIAKSPLILEQTKEPDIAATPPTHLKSLDVFRINLLILIPYSLTYLCVSYLFDLDSTSVEARISSALLSFVAVLPWLASLRMLRKLFYDYHISIGIFSILYAAFLLPVIDISISLHTTLAFDSLILIATALLSWIFTATIRTAVEKYRHTSSVTAFASPATIILLVIVAAVVIN